MCAGVYLDMARTIVPRFSIVRVMMMMNRHVDMVNVHLESVTATRIGPWMRRKERVPRRRHVERVIATVKVRASTESVTVLLAGKEMHVTRNPSVRMIVIIEDFVIRVSVSVLPVTQVLIVVLTWRESRRRSV